MLSTQIVLICDVWQRSANVFEESATYIFGVAKLNMRQQVPPECSHLSTNSTVSYPKR